MSAVDEIHTWEETEDLFRKAASPSSRGGHAFRRTLTAYDDVERLIFARPGWKPVSAAPCSARCAWSDAEEIAAIRRAIEIAVSRFRKAFGALQPGAVEAEISHLFGGENVVQFGPSSALPHGASTGRALAKGEAVLIDAWDRPEGYYYDITRSTFFGAPTDEYRKIWSVVLEAQSAAIDKAAPGIACSEVDAAARRVIDRAGYGDFFTHRLGHGLGIDVHEPPHGRHDQTVFEPGMVFTSEPGVYILESSGANRGRRLVTDKVPSRSPQGPARTFRPNGSVD
jgi:Xaa-Pro aminopeptidase